MDSQSFPSIVPAVIGQVIRTLAPVAPEHSMLAAAPPAMRVFARPGMIVLGLTGDLLERRGGSDLMGTFPTPSRLL